MVVVAVAAFSRYTTANTIALYEYLARHNNQTTVYGGSFIYRQVGRHKGIITIITLVATSSVGKRAKSRMI